MSKSIIPVKISHDGEYCGGCWFLVKKMIGSTLNVLWCDALDDAVRRTPDNKVERCDACLAKAVPVEAKPVEVSTPEAQQKKDMFDELRTLAVPLQEWLLKNYDMMCKIMIEAGHVEVLRSELGVPMEVEREESIET